MAVRKTNEVLMRLRHPLIALAILVSVVAGTAQEGKLSNPDASFITLNRPGGWTTGVRIQFDRRQFETDAAVLDTDILHAVGHLGVNVLPFLNVGVELGFADASRPGLDGNSGMEWAVTAHANLLEHVTRQSTITGIKESLRLNIGASYMQTESDSRDGDLDWSEFTVIPALSYVFKRRPETLWYRYEPTGLAVHAGLAYSSVEGDFGTQSFHEQNSFGPMVGLDILLDTGWVASIDANIYGSSDREVSLGLKYNF